MAPIIITLAVDPASQCLLNSLRNRHFPPEQNFIETHITLFHALDGSRGAGIITDVHAFDEEPFQISAESLHSLGPGVTISIMSDRSLASAGGAGGAAG